MCDEWHKVFDDRTDVTITCGDFFSLETDCVVSPANSFGFMDGGLDYVISEHLGWDVQDALQKKIVENHHGELLVGQAELIYTSHPDIPFCISAPTMRVPEIIVGTVNVYLAARAVFRLLKSIDEWIIPCRPSSNLSDKCQTVTMSGLGTGCGGMSPRICAAQMRRAYDHAWVHNETFPTSWRAAQTYHEMIRRGM